MPSTRRSLILIGATFLSGCGMRTPSDQHERRNTGTRTDTTSEEESSLSKPDVTRQFGETYVDTGLEITVETPTLEATFDYDGETYEMPDGEALAIVPITFSNMLSEETLPIDGPLFTLLDGTIEILETHSVEHPEFDPSIRIREIEAITTTQRWTAQGGAIAPDEQLTGTAVFHLPDTTELTEPSIAYESSRIKDDRFGDKIVAWTK
ncbi:hypothetical protein NGM10_06960 [Halorussus salilacus]|uniref:hypothetical protein n=1 Tax=Halorussus salilacus TaxID=2953750 RepID=UPI0020A0FA76|nr:hypothetical protein [Halorussus salilacus]USZ69468.1 hypothetical protein NGM10_06960 [Halorussus salilacus]